MTDHEALTDVALRSLAARDAPDVTARALAIALAKRAPRCVVGVGLGATIFETARATLPFAFPTEEYLRLVTTGRLPYDPRALDEPHRDRWVEPLRGFLDPIRYRNSPVGRLLAECGLFYFGRHFVCEGARIVASIAAFLPVGIDRFTDDEVAALSSSAATLGPIVRLQAIAAVASGLESALMDDAEQNGRAAFLVAPTGAVVSMSRAGAALLSTHPLLHAHLERIGGASSTITERMLPTIGARITVTRVPTAPRDHRLVTVTRVATEDAPSLTSRQRELLDHVERGLNNREIATVMELSPATVKTMLQRLYERTETAGRMELVQWRRGAALHRVAKR
jgi:DNA-binding CsgD family transcriptional regulator